mgnify:CR=1 FL=1
MARFFRRRRFCKFTAEGVEEIDYKDIETLKQYVTETGSAWGAEVLDNLDDYIRRFWLVKPKAASLRALLTSTRANPQ